MKGFYQRFKQKQKTPDAVDTYTNTLTALTEGSSSKTYRQGDKPLIQRLRVGNVYAVRTPDNEAYWRSVYIKKVPLTGAFQIMVSNAIYGEIPSGIDEVPAEQVFKQMREMNASLVSDTGTDLRTAPYEQRVYQ